MKLPEMRFEFTVIFWFLCAVLGLASHASQSYLEGKKLSWAYTGCHFILSMGAGLLAVIICCHYDLQPYTTGLVCYIAGAGSTRFINLVFNKFYSKVGEEK